mgnify:CR=1 FL=1
MFTQNIKLHVISLIILLSGCTATQEMVDRAQATANRALATAQTANTRAENAERAAEDAHKAARDANYDYNGIIERMERMFKKAQEK